MSLAPNLVQKLKSKLASHRKIVLLVLAVFVFTPLTLLFTNTTAVTPSIDGAIISSQTPSVAQIVDAKLNTWIIQGGVIYQNNIAMPLTHNVIKLIYLNGLVYQENSSLAWWYWNGSAWISSASTPLVTSTNLTKIPGAARIIDNVPTNPNIWVVVGGVIYENGVASPNTANVIELSYINSKVYQENSALHWWFWDGTAWSSTWPVPAVGLVAESGTFDLNTTLPAGTPTGGTFAVDNSGSLLPAEIALSACGIISNTSTIDLSVDSVVFSYDDSVPCK